jgi:hypothetical protein
MVFDNFFNLDEIVYDDLTQKQVKIIGINYSLGYVNNKRKDYQVGNIGYWVDSKYLSGGRHEWELTKIC